MVTGTRMLEVLADITFEPPSTAYETTLNPVPPALPNTPRELAVARLATLNQP
jgi:hypothetical protein